MRSRLVKYITLQVLILRVQWTTVCCLVNRTEYVKLIIVFSLFLCLLFILQQFFFIPHPMIHSKQILNSFVLLIKFSLYFIFCLSSFFPLNIQYFLSNLLLTFYYLFFHSFSLFFLLLFLFFFLLQFLFFYYFISLFSFSFFSLRFILFLYDIFSSFFLSICYF